MATAKHTPPGDDSFRNSLLRSGAGAVGLVALVALVFAGIGALGPDTDPPTVASDAEEPAEPEDEGGEEPEDDAPEPAEDTDAPDAEEPEAPEQPDESDEPDEVVDEEATDDADEESEEPEEPEEPEEGEPDGSEPDREREFAPDSVTIQVLDGYQADGGAAASAVAASLREDGYRVVAENPSLRYEVTTVLWTPGYEAQAQQVASDLGAAEVRQQPGNLSDQVQLHVVVGADRG